MTVSSRDPRGEQLAREVVRRTGGYLTNTRSGEGFCRVCRGPIDPAYAKCRACAGWGTTNPDPVDLVLPIAYAGHNSQSRLLFEHYKNPAMQSPAFEGMAVSNALSMNVLMLLGASLLLHRSCIESGNKSISSVVTVPSTRHRDELTRIVGALAAALVIPHVNSSYVGPVPAPRHFRPDWYAVEARVSGHVLVIDDTWVSGVHPRSVAAAVKSAGAERVTVVTGSRWLSSDGAHSAEFFDQRREQPVLDLPTCLVTGDVCVSQ